MSDIDSMSVDELAPVQLTNGDESGTHVKSSLTPDAIDKSCRTAKLTNAISNKTGADHLENGQAPNLTPADAANHDDDDDDDDDPSNAVIQDLVKAIHVIDYCLNMRIFCSLFLFLSLLYITER